MKKRILAMLLVVVMVLGLVACGGKKADPTTSTTTPPTTAPNTDPSAPTKGPVPTPPPAVETKPVTIRLHYNRPDATYEGWNVWFWPFNGDGAAYQFAEENGEMVASITVEPGTLKVGYIVRLNEWEGKDVDADQFVELAGILGGTLDVYVESGVAGHRVEKGSDIVEGIAVTSAAYDGDVRVTVQTSAELEGEITNDTFVVYNSEGSDEIKSVTGVGNSYTIELAYPLDPMSEYTIMLYENGATLSVDMPDFFVSKTFEENYTYTGNDLGATYTKEQTTLRVWAPTAKEVHVNLYTDGNPATQAKPVEQVKMTKDVKGTWVATLKGDKNGTYYTYEVALDSGVNEACDPYARTTGVNGKRAMILDLASTNPTGWDTDKDPHYNNNFTDAVIYELHVRDLSSDASSGIQNAGKYLGLIETGTKTESGIPTGLDHIKDLGVTHIHLLPVYDFGSVNEAVTRPQFNWGYDPVNYNVPEGSYSTDPYNGEVRVKEFKQMVKGLHDNGISVIMDVVYNHVQDSSNFCFNQIVPGYFSRPGSNGSGCGNDTASERAMVSKYIVDSVKYWADEYHIDGFRFDLVGLIDVDTINATIEEVHKTHPNVKFYGEGWTMPTVTTKPGVTMTTQVNSSKTPEFAFFSDTIRDLLKGGVFDTVSLGFASGAAGKEATLKQCFKGMPSWCKTPSQSINYASCHDNYTLIDRIVVSTPKASWEDQVKMNNLAAAIYMTAQGIPFMQAGEEMLRSKPLSALGTTVKPGEIPFDHNSYNKSDKINSIKWNDLDKDEYMDTYNYYKGLIAFRKAHPALRLTNAADVNANVTAVDGTDSKVVAFQINGGVNGETSNGLFVIFNANATSTTVELPEGEWTIYINGEKAGTEALGTASGSVKVDGISAMVLVKG